MAWIMLFFCVLMSSSFTLMVSHSRSCRSAKFLDSSPTFWTTCLKFFSVSTFFNSARRTVVSTTSMFSGLVGQAPAPRVRLVEQASLRRPLPEFLTSIFFPQHLQ